MGVGFSMFLDVLDAIKRPIGPDLLARDRADSPVRWASARDLDDNFSMQGIGPQGNDLA